MQLSIFDVGSEPKKITKPIRLIELFAGYGSQALALKYLDVPFEHWKICEWAVKSIQAYKDMHFQKDDTDYSKDLNFDEIIEYLTQKGISANYNEPMTKTQIKRMGEQKCRTVYNNIIATHNLVSVCNCSGEDLEIKDTDKYEYILTYSFPCQDLSSAGLGKGMEKGSGTRSGLLWEVERLLEECSEKPQILLMENVPEVIGSKNIKHFAKWLERLESWGYHCYFECLNAKDYGIPQNRNRCFMVSVLGDYNYEFPGKMKLDHKLKDLLEDKVDEKYYLSDKMLDYCLDLHGTTKGTKWQSSMENASINKDIAMTIGCRSAESQRAGITNFVINNCNEEIKVENLKKQLFNNNVASGIETNISEKFRKFPLRNLCRTILANKSNGGIGVITNYRIRKLTPKECFRLMGVKDEYFERVAKNQSNASLYHLAGDSIVVDVLMNIFKKMV